MKTQRRQGIWLLLGLLLLGSNLSAQHAVSGTVFSESGDTLAGATIRVKGSNLGAYANEKGAFSIEGVGYNDTLLVSLLEHEPQVIPIDGRTSIRIRLAPKEVTPGTVVITAFGISREKKALGYGVGEVNVEDMTKAREVNLVESISGKVAGVQISRTSGGPGASSRIVIRGNSSLRGNNQPLFVVDGVPIDNSTNGSGGMWGGVDYGSTISDINPDDIESMTILKGPNAAALYGSRGANGVVVITTKKGRSGKGIGVTLNSTATMETPVIQRKFQNVYGAGTNGKFELNSEGIPFFNTSLEADSWGPRMEGQEYIDWDGQLRTYSPQPDNYKDFFQTGYTFTNSFSLDGGDDNSTFRLSYTNLTNRGTVPNSTFARNSVNFRTTRNFGDRITADAKVNYVRQDARNRLNGSDGRGVARNFHFMPRNISNASLADYKDEAGNEKIWFTPWAWQSNPYWVANENLNEDHRDRVIGVGSVSYQINEWMSLTARTGIDYWNERRNSRTGTGAFANAPGDYNETWLQTREQNSDFLLNAGKSLNENWDLSGNLGGNLMFRRYEWIQSRVDRLSIPHFYDIDFGQQQAIVDNTVAEKQINSLYGSAQIAYQGFLYLDITARNDWSSTLPVGNNSYFYPSASLSYVFSEKMELENSFFTFGKLRGSWAAVGADDDPYLTTRTFVSVDPDYNGLPRMTTQSVRPNPDLKPEITTSLEIGTDLRFFKNRLGVDFTFYRAVTKNQIVDADVSPASGYSKAIINAGEIQNQGLELMVTGTPVKTKDFTWNSTLTWTRNRSRVNSLDLGLETFQLAFHWNSTVEARPGEPYGQIVVETIAKDDQGNRLVGADGQYLKGGREAVGNFNPDWLMGFRNDLNYKGFSLSFLIDMRWGGEIYSATNMYGSGYSGVFEETLEGREAWYASEADREAANMAPENWEATGGFLAEGVYAPGTVIDGQDVSGQPNQTYMNPEVYWDQFSRWGDELHEPHVYDASFIKLREVQLTYRIPGSSVEKLRMTGVTVGIVGRNLWLIHKKVPNIDPESGYNNGNGQGIEYGTFPWARSLGVNLKVGF